MHRARRRTSTAFALLVILAVAIAMRFWRIDSIPPGFHFDESFEGLEAWRILTDPTYRPIFLPGNFGVLPLNAYANAITFGLFRLFGGEAGPTAMRVTAAFFGVLGVLAVFALGDEMRRLDSSLSQAFPVLAAAVLAVMRWHIHFSRMGIEPILTPLEWAAAIWLLLRGWRTGRWWPFAGCGVVLAASMYTYLGAWVVPLLAAFTAMHLVVSARRSSPGQPGATTQYVAVPDDPPSTPSLTRPSPPPTPRRRALGLLLTAAVSILLTAPLLWNFWRDPQLLLLRPSQVAATGEATHAASFWRNLGATALMFWPFGATGDLDPRRNLPGAPALSIWLAAPFLIGFGMALWRIRRPAYSLLVAGLIVLALPGVLSEYAPHFHRILGAVAPAAMLAALPLDWLWVKAPTLRSGARHARFIARSLVVLLLAAAAVTSARDYFVRWASLPDLYYAFDVGLWNLGRWIARQPADTPIYLTPRDADHPTLAFAWRTRADSHPPPVSFDGRHVLPFTAAQNSTDEVYAVIEHEDYRTSLLLPEVLPAARIDREFLDSAGNVDAVIYTRPAGTEPQGQPDHLVDVALGDGIRLLGYDVIPASPSPGDILVLRLHWLVDSQPAQDWTVFTHLLGPAKVDGSTLWAGYDNPPGRASLRTTRWQTGWHIIDEYPLALPDDTPEGAYGLEAGLYTGSGQRLPAVGTGLPLGRVEVKGTS